MDLLCYEKIKQNFIEQTNECSIFNGPPSSSPRCEGASPPFTRGGGGLVYGRMRDGSGPTGLGNGPPVGGLGLK